VYSFLGPPPGSLLGPAVVGVGAEVGSTAGPARSSSSSNPGQRGKRDRSG
jgi:hypothetical protein